MINKFQQGGNVLLKLVLDLAANGVSQEVILQLAQNQELWGQLVLIYLQQGILGVANALNLLSKKTLQTKAARRGAKLDYIKSLKHQCADDEELYYYKTGGSIVGCGCKKKEGSEIAKAQKGTAVDKFKNRKKEIKLKPQKQDLATRDSIRINSSKGDDELEATRPGNYKPNPKYNPKDPNSRTHIWVPDRTKEPYNKDKVKKDCGGSAIKKFKKHRLGGSLNGIPFMQEGTPKGGIKKEYVLPEYMKRPITGAPTILPGRGYSGLEKPALGLFNMFKTWVKGLPKTITSKDYLTGAAGVAGGIGLGYDDTHNLYVRKGLQKVNEATSDLIEWKPFSVENLTNPNRKTPKFKK